MKTIFKTIISALMLATPLAAGAQGVLLDGDAA